MLLNVTQLVRDHSTHAVLMRCSEFATQSTAVPAAMGMSAQGRTGGTPLSRLEWTNARGMDNLAEIREFLMSRHAKTTPAQAGIAPGPNRRVAGLRRTEVALLAGVSAEYCAELERGAIAGASASVLDALAQALQLNDTAHANLLDLARAADGTPILGRSPTERCSEARLQARSADHRLHCGWPQQPENRTEPQLSDSFATTSPDDASILTSYFGPSVCTSASQTTPTW